MKHSAKIQIPPKNRHFTATKLDCQLPAFWITILPWYYQRHCTANLGAPANIPRKLDYPELRMLASEGGRIGERIRANPAAIQPAESRSLPEWQAATAATYARGGDDRNRLMGRGPDNGEARSDYSRYAPAPASIPSSSPRLIDRRGVETTWNSFVFFSFNCGLGFLRATRTGGIGYYFWLRLGEWWMFRLGFRCVVLRENSRHSFCKKVRFMKF